MVTLEEPLVWPVMVQEVDKFVASKRENKIASSPINSSLQEPDTVCVWGTSQWLIISKTDSTPSPDNYLQVIRTSETSGRPQGLLIKLSRVSYPRDNFVPGPLLWPFGPSRNGKEVVWEGFK